MPLGKGRTEPAETDETLRPLRYDEALGRGSVTASDPEPADWADHQQFRRELREALDRGDPPGVPLEDAILMIDARIAADRR